MKIWLDDQYEDRKGWFSKEWQHRRWPNEVIELLSTGTVTHLSLDHDLGDEADAKEQGRKEITGYDVLLWIEEQVKLHDFTPPEIYFHSQNSVGVERMRRALNAINKAMESR